MKQWAPGQAGAAAPHATHAAEGGYATFGYDGALQEVTKAEIPDRSRIRPALMEIRVRDRARNDRLADGGRVKSQTAYRIPLTA